MRDLVLNHCSLTPPNAHVAAEWFEQMATSIVGLKELQVITDRYIRISPALRGCLYRIECMDGTDFYPLKSRERGASLKLALMEQRLIEEDLDPILLDRLRGCQATGYAAIPLNLDQGRPILLGALTNGVMVSFPSCPVWESDNLTVLFDELPQDDQGESKTKEVDNVSGEANAKAVAARHRERLRQGTHTPDEFWKQRAVLFPHLMFGRDVEAQLSRIDHGKFSDVMRKLGTLNDFARDWQSTKGPTPTWGNLVRPESETVRNNPDLSNQRVFTSAEGNKELYLLHTDFGKGDRIYLRTDGATHLVEIGYIGRHLRTKRY